MRHSIVRNLLLVGLLGSSSSWAQSAEEAESLLHAGDIDGALAIARSAVEANPSDRASHEVLIDILMNRGLGATAQAVYQEFKDQNPQSPRAWTLLGRASTRAQSATEAYQEALNLDPHYAPAWVGMGDVYRSAGSLENAQTAYQKAIELDAAFAAAYTGLGALFLQHGKQAEALSVVQQAILQVPGDSEAYLAGARLSPSQAETFLSKGASAASHDPRIHAALGELLLRSNRLPEAKDSLSRATRIHAHHPEASRHLQLIADLENDRLDFDGFEQLDRATALLAEAPEAAIDLLEQLVTRYPNCTVLSLTSAQALVAENRLDEAQARLESGLSTSPDDTDLNATLGLLLQAREQHGHALPRLEVAALNRPGDPSLQLAYGISAANVRGPRTAAQIFATSAERFPSDPRPAMALATLLARNGDPQSAYTVLERAVAQYPSPDLVLALAGAAKDIGKTQEAAAALRKLTELTGDPSWTRAADSLGED